MRTNVTFADLVAIARRVGVKVVEAPSSHRGKLGTMGTVRGLTLHHTGTPNTFRPTVDYPDFNVVKEGREGLWNSLSAWGIGRFEAIYVFSESLSWHAGAWDWKGLTDGNGDFLGIEAAGIGDWTEWQRKVYPRLVASALLFLGEGTDMAPRHMDGATPRGRKTDAAHFDGNFYQGKSFYQWVEFFLVNPQYININYGGDDVMNAGQEAKLDKVLHELTFRHPSRVPGSKFTDTVAGYVLNIDAATYQSLQLDRGQSAAIAELTKVVGELAASRDASVDGEALANRLDETVRAAMAEVVEVKVTVGDPNPVSG